MAIMRKVGYMPTSVQQKMTTASSQLKNVLLFLCDGYDEDSVKEV